MHNSNVGFFGAVPDYDGYFYRVRNIVARPVSSKAEPHILFQTQIYLTHHQMKYTKYVYTVQDLMVEIGGYSRSLSIACITILFPIVEVLFYLEVMQRLYDLEKPQSDKVTNQIAVA